MKSLYIGFNTKCKNLCAVKIVIYKVKNFFRPVKTHLGLAGYVWIYCVICWFIQDLAKVGAYRLMKKYNMFNINTPFKGLSGSAKDSLANYIEAKVA